MANTEADPHQPEAGTQASQKEKRKARLGGATGQPSRHTLYGEDDAEVDQWPWGQGEGHRTEMALQDAWQRNPMSLWGTRQKYVAKHSHGRTKTTRRGTTEEKPATGTRDEGGKNSCEPGPQPQSASAPSASAHGKKAEREDKVQY